MNRYIVKVSAACMPSSCWGRYVRVGLLEVDPRAVPGSGISMISERARGSLVASGRPSGWPTGGRVT
jgi:hypothetical protein